MPANKSNNNNDPVVMPYSDNKADIMNIITKAM